MNWTNAQLQNEKAQNRKIGGADRIRTGDLHAANVPLSQLSYCPVFVK
jgi:hypothetical protein